MATEERAESFSGEAGRSRKIIHIDMDAFYASVEQRDNPELRGKPVAVGGSRERGVVAAASYEARKFGVHSAMPSITAKRKCPDLIFVRPRFDAYKAISLQIREIFAEYTPIIEPLSLDEAYLDVTENLKGIVWATQIAEEIRAKIRTLARKAALLDLGRLILVESRTLRWRKMDSNHRSLAGWVAATRFCAIPRPRAWASCRF
jgi:DNA polymerase-4